MITQYLKLKVLASFITNKRVFRIRNVYSVDLKNNQIRNIKCQGNSKSFFKDERSEEKEFTSKDKVFGEEIISPF